jgi:citrate lyase subunit beta/citryl-CoA lyase
LNTATPFWRSLLFVPATSDRFVAAASKRGADAVILDLEDSIPADDKDRARAILPAQIARLAAEGADLVVRINGGAALVDDLGAAARAGVRAIMVPKVAASSELARVAQALDSAEAANGLAAESIAIFALLEDPFAVFAAADIARSGGRLRGLGFGAEDFSAAMGVRAGPEALTVPGQMVAMAARGAKLQCIGLPGSIASIGDLAELAALGAKARALGFTGSVCIHPAQVPVLNAAFSPSEAERDWAQAIVDGFEAAMAEGRGAVAVAGRMVDKPVYEQALALLAVRR